MIRYHDLQALTRTLTTDVLLKYHSRLSAGEIDLLNELLINPSHTAASAVVVSKRSEQIMQFPILHTMLVDLAHLMALDISVLADITPTEALTFMQSYGVGVGRVGGASYPWVAACVVLSLLGIGDTITVLFPAKRHHKPS